MAVSALLRWVTRHVSGDCRMPCDDDCEIGPVHCWNHHRVNWKPDWHDPEACDERSMRNPLWRYLMAPRSRS